MTCEDADLLKVGISKDPLTRIKTLSSMYDLTLVLDSVFDVGDDAGKTEREIHELLKDSNIRFNRNENDSGVEWFTLSHVRLDNLCSSLGIEALDEIIINVDKKPFNDSKTKQITIDEEAHENLSNLKKLYIEKVGRNATFSEVIKNIKLKK